MGGLSPRPGSVPAPLSQCLRAQLGGLSGGKPLFLVNRRRLCPAQKQALYCPLGLGGGREKQTLCGDGQAAAPLWSGRGATPGQPAWGAECPSPGAAAWLLSFFLAKLPKNTCSVEAFLPASPPSVFCSKSVFIRGHCWHLPIASHRNGKISHSALDSVSATES